MKVSDVMKKLKAAGWYYVNTEGSHHHYEHADLPGKVTVPGKPSDDIAIGTLIAIEKTSGVKMR